MRQLVLLTLLCLPGPVAGATAPAQVTATVDSDRIGVEDVVSLTIRVEGPGAHGARLAGGIDDTHFRLVGNPRIGTSLELRDGRTRSTATYTLVLAPRAVGRFQLPAVEVLLDGETLATAPIEIEVVAGSLQSRSASPPSRPGHLAPWGTRDALPDPGEDLVVRQEIEPGEVYIGQPAVLTLWVYTRVNLLAVDADEEGRAAGVGHESIPLPESIDSRRETRRLGGQDYHAYPLVRRALLPNRPGAYELTPWSLRLQIGERARSLFLPDRSVTVRRVSNPLVLTVRDFPTDGRPPDFSGLCGHFRLTARLDRDQAPAGEGVTLTVVLSGSGNFRALADPPPPAFAAGRVFSPRVSEQIRLDGGTFTGERSWEYVLIPLQPGPAKVEPLRLTVFDPVAGVYRDLTSPALPLQVLPTSAGPAAGLPPRGGPAPQPIGEDIRFLRVGPGVADPAPTPLHRRGAVWVGVAGWVAATVLLAGWLGLRPRWAATPRAQAARAASRARRGLRRCRRLCAGPPDRLHAAVGGVWGGYLTERFGLTGLDLTASRLRTALPAAGLTDRTSDEVIELWILLDNLRFTPGHPGPEPSSWLDSVGRLLERVEGEAP